MRDIYHKIYVINKHIEIYPFYKEITESDRNTILGLIETVKGDIDNWIKTINNFYGWKKNLIQ